MMRVESARLGLVLCAAGRYTDMVEFVAWTSLDVIIVPSSFEAVSEGMHFNVCLVQMAM